MSRSAREQLADVVRPRVGKDRCRQGDTGALGADSIIAGLTSGPLIKRIGERHLAILGLVDGAVGGLLRMVDTVPAALAGSSWASRCPGRWWP